jgi:hypothetical protein
MGALLIVHDATYIHGYLSRIWRHTFGRALVQMALIALVILGLMRWSVFGPIHQMAEWMKKLRAGETVGNPPLPHSDLFAPLAKEASRFARHLNQAKTAAEEEARLRQTAESLWTPERLKEHVKLKLKRQAAYCGLKPRTLYALPRGAGGKMDCSGGRVGDGPGPCDAGGRGNVGGAWGRRRRLGDRRRQKSVAGAAG